MPTHNDPTLTIAGSNPSELSARQSARVILLDHSDRILLLRHHVLRAGEMISFWATPGGKIECGESSYFAAHRELKEELGLELELVGPIHLVHSRFEHKGSTVINTDYFYLARTTLHPISIQGIDAEEKLALAEARWWTLSEIERSQEIIFPSDIAACLRGLNQYP